MRQRFPLTLSTSLALAGLGTGILAYAHWVERARVQLDRYEVRLDKTGLPLHGLTILHLSDFHFRAADPVQSRRTKRLERLLAGQRYDILALTGDLIHDEAGLATAIGFLRHLRPRIAAFTVPGNRDYWQSSFRAILSMPDEQALSFSGRVKVITGRMRSLAKTFARNERARLGLRSNNLQGQLEALAQCGIEALINRSVHIQNGSIDFYIAGVDDLGRGEPNVAGALEGIAADRPVILLVHNPDIWLEPRAAEADVVLAGHTHGGQIRLPHIGAWYRQGTHLPRWQAAGWFERGTSTLFVTRGMGESFPFRLGARPQAALIRLVGS